MQQENSVKLSWPLKEDCDNPFDISSAILRPVTRPEERSSLIGENSIMESISKEKHTEQDKTDHRPLSSHLRNPRFQLQVLSLST